MIINHRPYTFSLVLTAVILLSGTLSNAQAPLCSGIFLAPITQIQIDKTVRSLAEMKMAADLAMSRGKKTLAAKRLHSSFSEKSAELLQRLESRMSKKQLRDLISEEIRKMQMTESDSIKVESQTRSEERAIQDSLIKKRFEVNFPSTSSEMRYIPSLNSIVISGKSHGTAVYVMNLDNGTTERIGDIIEDFKVVGETVHMFGFNAARYHIYDLNKKQDISPPHVNGRTLSIKNYLSPDAQLLVAENSHNIIFSEIANPEHKFLFKNPNLPGKFAQNFLGRKLLVDIKRSQFISKSQVFVMMNNNTYYNFDTSSKRTKQIDLGDFIVRAMKPALDAGILAFNSENSVAIIPSDRLSFFKKEAKVKTLIGEIADISISPDGQLIYIASIVHERLYRQIYSTQDFTLVHQFETSPLVTGEGLLASPVFDINNKRMIFGNYETDGAGERQNYVDIWSYRE